MPATGEATEFLYSNRVLDYPFVDGSGLSTYRAALLDAYLVHRRNTIGRIKLYRTKVSTTPGEVELRNEDGTNFLVTADFQLYKACPAVGTGIFSTATHIWTRTTVGDEAQLVLVFNYSFSSVGLIYTSNLVYDGFLVDRCVERVPLAVDHLYARTVAGGSDNDVTLLKEGKNILLSPGAEPNRGFTTSDTDLRPADYRLRIDAVAGAGAGRDGASCAPEGIISISHVPAADGHFTLDADKCYWLDRGLDARSSSSLGQTSSTRNTRPGYLKIHNDCQACCHCDEFVDTYERLRTMVARARGTFQTVNLSKGMYENIRQMILDRQACSPTHGQVQLFMNVYAYNGWLVQVQVAMVNGTECEVPGMSCLIYEPDHPVEYVVGSGFVYVDSDGLQQYAPHPSESYGLSGNWSFPALSPLPPGQYSMATLTLYFSADAGRLEGSTHEIHVIVEGGGREPIATSREISLLGNRVRD